MNIHTHVFKREQSTKTLPKNGESCQISTLISYIVSRTEKVTLRVAEKKAGIHFHNSLSNSAMISNPLFNDND